MLCEYMNIWCVYKACMSPAPSGSLALQCVKLGDALKIWQNTIWILSRTARYGFKLLSYNVWTAPYDNVHCCYKVISCPTLMIFPASLCSYDEDQYDLARWEDLSVSRQGMFDDTYHYIPTQGWMFVPFIQYHGGEMKKVWLYCHMQHLLLIISLCQVVPLLSLTLSMPIFSSMSGHWHSI